MHGERLVIVALLAGNFVVATCATMLVALVPELSRALRVDAATVGQMVTLSGVVMCVVAPLAPVLGRRVGRRTLLVFSLALQGLALIMTISASTLGGMMLWRVLQVVGPAVFTAQAAALLPLLLPPQRLGRETATIYLGWPLALVLGMPFASWASAAVGWPWVFGALGALSLVVAWWVWRVLPPIPPAARPNHTAPRETAAGVWSCLVTTAMASAAQLALLTYFTSFGEEVLHAVAGELALALAVLGALGVLGVSVVGRLVDRHGASRSVMLCLILMAVSMLVWPLGTSLPRALLVLAPWALSAFALNAAQQARLVRLDPDAGPRNVGLNTAFVYLGQGLGAALGGYWISLFGYRALGHAALGLLVLAVVASLYSTRRSAAFNPQQLAQAGHVHGP